MEVTGDLAWLSLDGMISVNYGMGDEEMKRCREQEDSNFHDL